MWSGRDRPQHDYSGSPEHEAHCVPVDRDAHVPCMYPWPRESSVNAGWEEQKKRRDGEKVG